MDRYDFITNWSIPAPVDMVWRAIEEADSWPRWWRGVLSNTEIRPGDADGVGSIRRSVWRSALPYTLEFDSEVIRVEKPHILEVRAFGQLEGRGLWTLTADGDATRVRYDWSVDTNKAWMRLLAPLARPLFRWNHDVIMRWGEEGLVRYLADQ